MSGESVSLGNGEEKCFPCLLNSMSSLFQIPETVIKMSMDLVKSKLSPS